MNRFIILFLLLISTSCYSQVSDSITIETPISIDSNYFIRKQHQEWGQTRELGQIDERISFRINTESSVVLLKIPTCSCLNKKGEEWFLSNSTIPYSGMCVVMSNSAPKDSLAFIITGLDYESSIVQRDGVIPNPDKKYLGEIRILSNYLDGKRHGKRTYYNSNGSIIIIESYSMGKLELTEHCENGSVIRTESN